MIERTAMAALALVALAELVLVTGGPVVVRVPLVVACLVAAPGLALSRFLPTVGSIERIALGVGFGVGLVVIASELLAIWGGWSGPVVLLVVGAVTIALAMVPSPARSRAGGARDTGVAGGDTALRAAIRVLWLDGRVCCSLVVDRRAGTIIGLELGRFPTPRPAPGPGNTPPAEAAHAADVVADLARRYPTTRDRDGLRIDLERRPWASQHVGQRWLWLGPGPDEVAPDDVAVERWLVGEVEEGRVALGLNERDDPVVIALPT